jgi:hypothetical protein
MVSVRSGCNGLSFTIKIGYRQRQGAASLALRVPGSLEPGSMNRESERIVKKDRIPYGRRSLQLAAGNLQSFPPIIFLLT